LFGALVTGAYTSSQSKFFIPLTRIFRTGYGTHADYVFGWQGDALQRVLDSECYVNCPVLKTQTIEEANKCSKAATVNEPIDGCELPVFIASVPVLGPGI
jgi:hypothetical protein